MTKFSETQMANLWRPSENSAGEDNGQVTIIGGSSLFQGAPLLSAMAVSRSVDMVFVATPEEDKEIIGKTELFSRLRSVIWIPRDEIEAYVEKSDAILIGPGMMRWRKEKDRESELENGNEAGEETKKITERMLKAFGHKKWVIDGGSLQVMESEWIPEGAILTPNMREFQILFNSEFSVGKLEESCRKYKCVIGYKGAVGYVSDGQTTYEVDGGNAGLTKGGTGDVLAGVITGLVAKNDPLLAAACGMFLVKKTAERLAENKGYGFNADDLAVEVFETKKKLVGF